jgi:hypothetical protein
VIWVFVAIFVLAAVLAWGQWADGTLDSQGAVGMTILVGAFLVTGFWLITRGAA